MAIRLLLLGLTLSWMGLIHVAPTLAQEEKPKADFAIRDGDVVGFLGDSITAERTYGKHIEQYTLMRYPDRQVTFLNVGIGGDTAAGGLKRLKRDVFDNGVTVLTVAYGINDIGWGTRADDEHKQLYLDSIREIVRQCRAQGVRVYICSAAITAEDPDQSEQSYLQKMCDEGLEVARQEGGQTIPVQRTMREIQKRLKPFNAERPEKEQRHLHVADGIHLNDLGQLAMAYAILKGLGAEELVSSAQLDAKQNRIVGQDRCQISDCQLSPQGGQFTRLDQGLPYNYGPFAGLNYGWVPMPSINQYRIQVQGLEPGQYDLTVDGRGVAQLTQQQLEEGIDISSSTTNGWIPGGPWDAQANMVRQLTDARSKLAESQTQRREYFPEGAWSESLADQAEDVNRRLEELQRSTASPRPYRFKLTRREKL